MNEDLLPEDFDNLDPEKVLAHMGGSAVFARWEGTVAEMLKVTEIELCTAGIRPEAASEIARRVVFAICDQVGGTVMYMPRASNLKRAVRDAEIHHDWSVKGIKVADMVRKYSLSSQTIYDIIARQRALHRRSQPDLFGFDDGTIH